ncbi:MAG: MotA/TolQ/ExbB proton channel family protein [Endomicrobium sp.]|jgi:biopolymer transport protein ExbB|nr:MotA/TolQ/ExbB proton channel family protein [Endomicrobium sp.]
MFENKGFIDIINMGGGTLYVLFIASVLSIAVICFKSIEFRIKSKIKRSDFVCKLIEKIKKGDLNEGINFCNSVNSPMASVSKVGIVAFKERGGDISEVMGREVLAQTVKLENYTVILGTLGSVTVYVGLFGTILGIIKAFHNISTVGAGGITVVVGGVSEALIATAGGLFVAIPAVIAYNFFAKSIDKFVVDMEYCVSAVEESLTIYYRKVR